MWFEPFNNNTFVLNNPTDGCTRNQGADPERAIIDYCVCYDTYKPGGILNCPSIGQIGEAPH
jgi:hypothetical protein